MAQKVFLTWIPDPSPARHRGHGRGSGHQQSYTPLSTTHSSNPSNHQHKTNICLSPLDGSHTYRGCRYSLKITVLNYSIASSQEINSQGPTSATSSLRPICWQRLITWSNLSQICQIPNKKLQTEICNCDNSTHQYCTDLIILTVWRSSLINCTSTDPNQKWLANYTRTHSYNNSLSLKKRFNSLRKFVPNKFFP